MRLAVLMLLSISAFGQAVYPLKVSSNKRYLVDQNNHPFLLVGDAPQAIIGMRSEADAALYFADRRAHGFNAAWINLLCDVYTFCNSTGMTFDGIAPFTTGTGPSSYDLSTPNPTYFSKVDDVLNLAAQNGIVVFLDPIETGGWTVTLENNGSTKAFNYGAFLGARYKNVPNIVWLSGNDFQTWPNTTPIPTDNTLVRQVMAGIASKDPNHLQTVELNYSVSYSNQDTALAPYVNLDLAYTYDETYDCILRAYNSTPVSPVFLGESNYEGETIGDGGSLGNLRKEEYWTLTSGSTGLIYGEYQTDQTDWTNITQIDTPGVAQLEYATRLFNSIAWWILVPDQNHQIIIAGYGTYSDSADIHDSTYATTAWIPDGSASITFAPVSTILTVETSKFKSPITARWMDPTNGAFQIINGSPFPNTGTTNFSTPGANSAGSSDWVLVLTTATAGRNRVVLF